MCICISFKAVLLLGYIHICYGDLYCLTCFEVVSPRHCKFIRRCADGQRCQSKRANPLLERFSGSKKYVYTPHTTACRECCSTTACNRKGCVSQDYPEIRGPACFDCQQTRDPALCRSVAVCEQGEVCQTHMKTVFGDKIYTLACAPDFVCSREYLKPDGCNQCCKSDFCNRNLCNYFNRPYGYHVVLESDHGPGVLDFKTVITNVGDGYNQQTGYFTPETNGTFVFTWNIESFNESAIVALEVNGEEIIQTRTTQKYLFHYSGSSFAILNVHEGDHVYLKLIEGITKKMFTFFTGWKQNSDMLPALYAVCPFGDCLYDDMQIVTNNFVYDNISNIIQIGTGFYLPMETRNEHLEYNVPVWANITTGNFSDRNYNHNASGFLLLSNFDEASCNVLEQVPKQSFRTNAVIQEKFLHPFICMYHIFPIDPYSSAMKFSIKQTGLYVIAIRVRVHWENVVFSLKVNNVEMFQMSVRAFDYVGYPYGNSAGSMFSVQKFEMNDEISFKNVSGSFESGSFASWIIVKE